MKEKYTKIFKVEVFVILLNSVEGIPILYWSGTEAELNIIVIELLGPNLKDLLNQSQEQFHIPLKPSIILPFAIQCVSSEVIIDKSYTIHA